MTILGGWICAYCHNIINGREGKACPKAHPDRTKCDSFVRIPSDIRSYRNKPKKR